MGVRQNSPSSLLKGSTVQWWLGRSLSPHPGTPGRAHGAWKQKLYEKEGKKERTRERRKEREDKRKKERKRGQEKEGKKERTKEYSVRRW